jgi:hypothetical protein
MQLLALCAYGILASGAVGAAGVSWMAAQFAARNGRTFEFTDGLLFGSVAGAFAVVPVTLACLTTGSTEGRGSIISAIATVVLFGLVEGAVVGGPTWSVIYRRERLGRGIPTRRHN